MLIKITWYNQHVIIRFMAINCRLSIIFNMGKCISMFLKKEKSSRVHIYLFIKDLYTKCTQIYKYNVEFCTYDKVALFE